jgi:hypothetical protein
MILRRFPWKLPDMKTDPSFKLFVKSHPELCLPPEATGMTPSTSGSIDVPSRQSILASTTNSTPVSSVHANHVFSLHEHSALRKSLGMSTLDQGDGGSGSGGDDDAVHIRSAKEAGYMTPHSIHSDPHSPAIDDGEEHKMLDSGHGHGAFSEGTVASPGGLSPAISSPASPADAGDLARPGTQRSDSVSSASSQATYTSGAADSIFRLLPRETRSALSRMMAVEPSLRCTLGDLLRGRRFSDTDSPLTRTPVMSRSNSTDMLRSALDPAHHDGAISPKNLSRDAHAAGLGSIGLAEFEDDDDRGDDWLKGIRTCAHILIDPRPAEHPDHPHVKVMSDENKRKHSLFHRKD